MGGSHTIVEAVLGPSPTPQAEPKFQIPDSPEQWLRIWETDLSFTQRRYIRQVTDQDDLQALLSDLPPQQSHTVRFYEWSHKATPQPIDVLAQHLRRFAFRSSAVFHAKSRIKKGQDDMHMRKPVPILSQWLEDEEDHLLYDALVIDLQHNGREREIVDNEEIVSAYASKEHAHFRSTLKCCSISDDRLIVLSSIDVHGDALWLPTRNSDMLPEGYLLSSPVATGGFDISLCQSSRRVFIKMMVVRFFQVHFNLLQEESFMLLEMVHQESAASLRTGYDILCGDLEKLHFQISHMIRDVEFVIEDIQKTERLDDNVHLTEYMHWSQYQLNVAKENLSQALKSQQRYHNVFERQQSSSEAQSLKRLTIIAAVFLPLSLSSGILGMSVRFKDLGDKLFDFIGVFALIGSITIVLFVIIKLFYKASKSYKALQKGYVKGGPWTRILISTDKILARLIPIAILVSVNASFLVGMFIDHHKGDYRIGLIFMGTILAVIFLTVMMPLIRRTNKIIEPIASTFHQTKCPQCFPD